MVISDGTAQGLGSEDGHGGHPGGPPPQGGLHSNLITSLVHYRLNEIHQHGTGKCDFPVTGCLMLF